MESVVTSQYPKKFLIPGLIFLALNTSLLIPKAIWRWSQGLYGEAIGTIISPIFMTCFIFGLFCIAKSFRNKTSFAKVLFWFNFVSFAKTILMALHLVATRSNVVG